MKGSILAVVMLCAFLLSGCGDSSYGGVKTEQSPAPVELSFWNPFGGGEGDFVEQIIKDYNDSQHKVFVKQLRLESNEYYARLSTALSLGKGPDVAVAHVDRLSPFIKAKQIVPLDALANRVGFEFNGIEESNRQSVSYNGQYYAVPLDTHFHMLYYNKDVLQRAELLNADGTPKLAEATPEGFIRFLQQIRDRVPGVQPMAVNTPYFQESFLDLYYEAGGELLSTDLKKAVIHNEKAVQVLAFYQQLFDRKLSDLNDKAPWDSFYNGQAGLWFGGVWEAGHHLGNSSLNVGIMPLSPIFGSSVHWGSSHTLVVPAYVTEQKQDAAMDFMKYFSEVGGAIWGQAGHVPASRAIVQSTAYQALPYRKLFVISRDHVKFAPKTDKYAALYTAISEDLQNIVQNRIEPGEGLAALEKKLDQILAN
ncbi:extracellular solute-binding protein [Paenibacillus sp. HJL G12]|uniref:Extracellular solute-binding protein n=1 Tax=Paenibacillus dendrobii TaxID=2691084 RepID=A0A7X3LKG8_9BACL|nr:extracellular solute-binding protein [Paenibacillus dendrobii]MWV47240.1 extracellular solute-binding protein [Paenibacillus dendrobii]